MAGLRQGSVESTEGLERAAGRAERQNGGSGGLWETWGWRAYPVGRSLQFGEELRVPGAAQGP